MSWLTRSGRRKSNKANSSTTVNNTKHFKAKCSPAVYDGNRWSNLSMVVPDPEHDGSKSIARICKPCKAVIG